MSQYLAEQGPHTDAAPDQIRRRRLIDELTMRFGSSSTEVECTRNCPTGMGLVYRRLYTTDESFFGLGPPCMQPGDEVWIDRGARVPFVLRPRGTGDGEMRDFTLLGETYVHGAMNEEALYEYTDEWEITLC